MSIHPLVPKSEPICIIEILQLRYPVRNKVEEKPKVVHHSQFRDRVLVGHIFGIPMSWITTEYLSPISISSPLDVYVGKFALLSHLGRNCDDLFVRFFLARCVLDRPPMLF